MGRRLLERCSVPGIELVLWEGTALRRGAAPVLGRVVVRDRAALYQLLLDPDVGFGDAFSEGRIEVEGDLVRMLEAIYDAPWRPGFFGRIAAALWRQRGASNTPRGSRRNIHRHYDLGNEFFELWLDPEMVYTCAYFPTPTASLEQAQVAKLEHVARKIWVKPGDRVLELGCGWGSLALHLARHHGADVTAYNISSEQVRFARERAQREDLGDRVRFVEDDYRNADGRYDAVVAVGMLEHVGARHHLALGETIERCLREEGRGLLHSIGRVQPRPMDAWIERRIFPGSYAPTLDEMVGLLARFDMSVLDVENLRLHYARTLEHWLERYEKHSEWVRQRLGDSFARAWRLYLAGSIAAFRKSSLQLWQVVFARARSNAIPWTRASLGEEERPAWNAATS
jgi:cyclopropane-fatty-acyl-phospholipid synthase